jgi:hypothetical protein
VTARARGLKVRTGQGMVVLTAAEAGELQDRLARVRAGQPASQTMAVSANASTSVTFTEIEKAAVFTVLEQWLEDPAGNAVGGLLNLKLALAHDLGRE